VNVFGVTDALAVTAGTAAASAVPRNRALAAAIALVFLMDFSLFVADSRLTCEGIRPGIPVDLYR
jgi:hypothetical protein